MAGPHAGLDLLDRVDGADRWHLYWSTRAALLRRAGELESSVEAYLRALELPMNDSDRRFLEAQLADVEEARAAHIGRD